MYLHHDGQRVLCLRILFCASRLGIEVIRPVGQLVTIDRQVNRAYTVRQIVMQLLELYAESDRFASWALVTR